MSKYPVILFCGDPHGKFDHIYDQTKSINPDAIVLLGDMDASAPLSEIMLPVLEKGVEVLWIPGNHDTDSVSAYENLFLDAGHPKLHCIHNTVYTVVGQQGNSVRIAGLGGVFRSKAWWPRQGVSPEEGTTSNHYFVTMGKGNRWRGGLPLKHRSTIFADQWLTLSQMRADILVTHEAPGFHPNGFATLHELAVKMGATKSFHGHHHGMYDYGEHDRVHAFGVGIYGIMDEKGQVLSEE